MGTSSVGDEIASQNTLASIRNNYHQHRYDENLNNVTPENVWVGRGQPFWTTDTTLKPETLQLPWKKQGAITSCTTQCPNN